MRSALFEDFIYNLIGLLTYQIIGVALFLPFELAFPKEKIAFKDRSGGFIFLLATALVTALVSLLIRTGRIGQAFGVAERLRSSGFLDLVTRSMLLGRLHGNPDARDLLARIEQLQRTVAERGQTSQSPLSRRRPGAVPDHQGRPLHRRTGEALSVRRSRGLPRIVSLSSFSSSFSRHSATPMAG